MESAAFARGDSWTSGADACVCADAAGGSCPVPEWLATTAWLPVIDEAGGAVGFQLLLLLPPPVVVPTKPFPPELKLAVSLKRRRRTGSFRIGAGVATKAPGTCRIGVAVG